MATRNHTATTTKTQCVSVNLERRAVLITNNSGATAFVSENETNVTTEGTPIAVGETLESIEAFGDDATVALYCQTLLGTADLRILESFGMPAYVQQRRNSK